MPKGISAHFKGRTSKMVHFFDKVPIGAEGCWEWQARRFPSGYGQFAINSTPRRAHRVCWEMLNGPIPDGMQVNHHCDNRACVRPDHLYVGTQSENMQDAVRRGRQAEIRKTHCRNGHPYDVENTYVRDNGKRRCRACIVGHEAPRRSRKHLLRSA